MKEIVWVTREAIDQWRARMAWADAALASRVGTLLRSLVQFFFQPVAVGDVQHVKLLELVEQLLRRSRVVTITLPFGHDLALVGNMPLGFGNGR